MTVTLASLHVQTIQVDGKTFEQRYAVCSRKNCWCATPEGVATHAQPGHGPYWYRVVRNGEITIRRYVGKNLTTETDSKRSRRNSRNRE